MTDRGLGEDVCIIHNPKRINTQYVKNFYKATRCPASLITLGMGLKLSMKHNGTLITMTNT